MRSHALARLPALGVALAASWIAACAAGSDETSGSTSSAGSGPGSGGATGSTTTAATTTGATSSAATTGTTTGGAGGEGQGGATSSSVATTSASMAATTGAGGAPPLDAEVWGHSAATLYKLDPNQLGVTTVGNFDCVAANPGLGLGMWDIALDKDGAMVGTGHELFNGVLVSISKVNAHCTVIATGEFPNSLTFVPEGTLDPAVEVLVGYSGAEYVRIDPANGAQTVIGNLNPNPTGQDWESSGDIVALIGGQAYLTVKPLGSGSGFAGSDHIVEVDVLTGKATVLIGDTTYPKLWGLGYWAGVAYGFSSTGQLVEIDLLNASTTPVPIPGGFSFWGAGVTTAAPHL